MGFHQGPMPNTNLSIGGLNLATLTTSETVPLFYHSRMAYSAFLATGSWGAAVINLQCSTDNSNWVNVGSSTLTADGVINNIPVIPRYSRVAVTTVSGTAATADIVIQAKE